MNTKSIINGRVIILLTAVLLLNGAFPESVSAASKEYKMKAAFIYQFAKFVKWPVEFGDSIKIGVYGQSPFDDALDTIKGKTAQGKTLVVTQISTDDELKTCCQIVFLSTSEQANFVSVLKILNGVSVLTIGEMEGIASIGGMIGFVQKGTKLKFEVNRGAVEKAGLIMSSQLLKVGIILQ